MTSKRAIGLRGGQMILIQLLLLKVTREADSFGEAGVTLRSLGVLSPLPVAMAGGTFMPSALLAWLRRSPTRSLRADTRARMRSSAGAAALLTWALACPSLTRAAASRASPLLFFLVDWCKWYSSRRKVAAETRRSPPDLLVVLASSISELSAGSAK